MPDWSQIIETHHAKAHPDDGYNLVTRPPATSDELDALGKSLGIDLPIEFRGLYLTYNGFGVTADDDPDETWWFFCPTDQIGVFADDLRNSFRENDAAYAKRFYPFIDFSNGDRLGYVVDESRKIIDGLFCFELELYKFDEDQDVIEFLTHAPVTIEEFLTQV